MILALDVGNTNITVGCIDDGEVKQVYRIHTNIARTADEYAVQISYLLEFQGIDRWGISGAIISSVVPPLTRVFRDAVMQLTGVDAVVVSAGVKTGLNILIDDPAELGGDLVATSVGALAMGKLPVIIVDLGTATKLIVLNNKGGLIGGAILPGVTLSMNALAEGTSQLPLIPIEAPAKSISSNTTECIKSGVVLGAASAIDGMIARFEEELGEPAFIIATGGLAGPVYPHCKRSMYHDPHLILRGLSIIYQKNLKK